MSVQSVYHIDFGLTQRDMKTIESIFQFYPSITEVKIFGSRAKGNFKPGSDIDLAIMNNEFDENRLASLLGKFEESSLPYFTEVVHYPSLKHQPLKEHIDLVGKTIYTR